MADSGAGDLRERVTFQRRAMTSDGYGNSEGDWADEFTVAAQLRPRLGGEVVLQERLAGRQPFTLKVRWSDQVATVTPEWRAVNARTGAIYNIRSKANPDERSRFIELLIDEGVST